MSDERYDFVVIGTGAGGLVGATVAAGLGLKVLCCEADRIGGECSWTGCVPSKALLHAADTAWSLRQGPGGGISAHISDVDTSGALDFVRRIREDMLVSGEALRKERGFDVRMGRGRIAGSRQVEIDGDTVDAHHILLTTGSHPFVPPIEGLEDIEYHTNTSIFDLPEPPESLAVIGGGPLGVEMASAFNRLGTEVQILERHDEIMPRDDAELAGRLREILADEGVDFHCNTEVTQVAEEDGQYTLSTEMDGKETVCRADEVLVATGRRANVEDLGLDEAGVEYDERGVTVNGYMRTTAPNIWAAGDITGTWQFSHIAEMEATIAVRNAVLGFPETVSYDAAGWTTFTNPELASCGRNERQVKESGDPYTVTRFDFEDDDRARTDEQALGTVKVVSHPRSGQIYGAQILGPRAGELIQEFITAIKHGIPVQKMGRTVHLYPSLSMAAQRAQQRWWEQWGARPTINRVLGIYLRMRGFSGRESE